ICPECGGSERGRSTCSRDGHQLVDSGHDDLLGRSVGNYRVARLLGRGGMGAVYLGVHPGIASRVAIKVITPEGARDGSDVQRFFAEARSVNLIQHENIVNVLSLAHLPDGRPYIVMEYIDGAPLSAWMRGGLGARRVLTTGIEILEALAAAHAKGIVHRDLKPDNVMITPEGRVKLLDFGIAKLRVEGEPTQHMTSTGAVLGTPTYMSPEQALARPADARSDLYSFGIVLYQGLAGQVPFKGDSLFEVLRQHVSVPPPPLDAVRPDLPEALARVVERTLAKDPNARPQSARELCNQLLALLPQVPDTLPPSLAQGGTAPLPTVDQPALPASPSRASRTSTEWLLPAAAPLARSSQHPVSAASLSLPAPATPRYLPLRPGALIEAPHTSAIPSAARLPWFLVGASGILLLIFAGLTLAAVAFFALRKSSTAEAPPTSTPAPEAPPLTTTTPTGAAPTTPIDAPQLRPPDSPPDAVTPVPREGAARSGTQSAPAPTPAPPAPANQPASSAGATAAEPVALSPIERLRAARLAPGDVKIESRPDGANITFDGRSVGKAPIDLGKVEQGKYVVVAALSGHRTRTFNLDVRAGSTTLVCVLSPER
ncbi:MAG TPA: protein kinase, partial [Polyangiaceae bacterium]